MYLFVHFLKTVGHRASDVLYIDGLPPHLQFLCGRSCQRNDNPGQQISQNQSMNQETGQDKDDTGPSHVPAEIGRETGYNSTQDTVVRITEQTAAGPRRFAAISLLARGGCIFLLPIVQFFGLAHPGYDLFHLFYCNNLQAAA